MDKFWACYYQVNNG